MILRGKIQRSGEKRKNNEKEEERKRGIRGTRIGLLKYIAYVNQVWVFL
jgi:hypothetical protein